MNRRLVKFTVGLSLCLIGLYVLVAGVLFRELSWASLGLQIPHSLVTILCLGVIASGVWLAQRAIIEELSVKSD